jgi:hypothetical protein
MSERPTASVVRALLCLLEDGTSTPEDIARLADARLPRTELLAHLLLDRQVLARWPRAATAFAAQTAAARFPATVTHPESEGRRRHVGRARDPAALSREQAERLLVRLAEPADAADVRAGLSGRRHA